MSMKSSFQALIVGALVSAVFGAISPTAVLAQGQDCGTNCGPCATGKKEAWNYHANGQYKMDCLEATTGCVQCSGGVQLVRESPVGADAILATVRSSSLAELVRLAPTLKGQVFVHRQRNLVAVRGEACAQDRVVALAFLPKDRLEVLARAGVGELTTFLNQSVVANR